MALCASVLASSGRAMAEPSRVVILRPPDPHPPTREALLRVDAELRTAGFEVVTIDAPLGPDVRGALEREAAANGALAAIVILPGQRGAAAEVWVVDRATGKTLIRTVEARQRPGESAPATLAIRAVDLLRASLLEADPARRPARPASAPPPPPALPPDAARWMAPARSPTFFRLDAAAAMLHGAGGLGPAFAPALRLSWGTETVAGRVAVVGPAASAALDVGFGEVSVRQELASLELVLAHRFRAGFVPTAHLGGGAYHLVAVGALEPPYRGATDDAWGAFFSTGVGIGYEATESLTPFVDVQALLTEPRPVVVVGGQRVGHAGRPTILLALGVAISLGR